MGILLPFGRPEEIPCTRCGAAILPGGEPPRKGLPGWMWIGVLLAALVLLGWVLRR